MPGSYDSAKTETPKKTGREPFSIVDLISTVGTDRVKVQFLSDAITNVAGSSKKGSKVTFATDQLSPNHLIFDTGPVGVVVWMPRADFDRARKAAGH